MTSDQQSAQGANDWMPTEERFANLRIPEWEEEMGRLRKHCPVAHTELFGGFYTLSRYEDVAKASRDFRTYRSGQPFIRVPGMSGLIPSSLNPPEHGVYRKVLNTYFRPEIMNELDEAITEYAADGISELIAAGGGDAVAAICKPVPARALATWLRLGEDSHTELLGHFTQLGGDFDDPQRMNELMFSVFAGHIRRVVADRRTSPQDPAVDVLQGILEMEVNGVPTSDETAVAVGVALIGAGHATTSDALGSAIYRLAQDQELQQRLRDNPEMVGDASEEFLRLDSPLPERGRHMSTDVELHGVTIPEGSLVALNYGSANRDEEKFERPTECLIDRSPNRHLAFGFGPHQCAGAPLARLEMRVVLTELLVRTSSFSLAGEPESVRGLIMNGLETLPLVVEGIAQELGPARIVEHHRW